MGPNFTFLNTFYHASANIEMARRGPMVLPARFMFESLYSERVIPCPLHLRPPFYPPLFLLLGLQRRAYSPPDGPQISPSPPSHSPMYHPCPPFLTYQ